MPREIVGELQGQGLRVAIAAARFNSAIVDRLVDAAVDCLVRHGVGDEDITVARCPGSWELPLLCRRFAGDGQIDAVIALGCVIRGDTAHFDYVAGQCASGVARAALDADKPVIFGVLTTDTVEQADNRSGIKQGNKGFDAALAAIETCRLLGKLSHGG